MTKKQKAFLDYLQKLKAEEQEERDRKRYEQCKTCRYYNLKETMCTRYNMISRPEQTCKSYKGGMYE